MMAALLSYIYVYMDLFNYGYIDMPGVTKEDAAKVLNRFGLKPSLGNDYDMEIKDTPGGCKAAYG